VQDHEPPASRRRHITAWVSVKIAKGQARDRVARWVDRRLPRQPASCHSIDQHRRRFASPYPDYDNGVPHGGLKRSSHDSGDTPGHNDSVRRAEMACAITVQHVEPVVATCREQDIGIAIAIEVARQKDLREHGIAAQREVEQTQTELDLADRELHRANSRLRLLGSNTNSIGKPMVVRAPIPGRVVEFKIAQGEMLNDLSAAVMTIADLSEVWITANVQEMDVRRVHVGQAASIVLIAYPELRFEGTVHVVGDLLNPETRTLSVTLLFKNGDRHLKPGMFGTVDFLADPESALVVDTSAVVHTGHDNQVFVEVAPWRFEVRTVQLDTSIDGKAIVLAGLKAGEKVVAQDAVVLQ